MIKTLSLLILVGLQTRSLDLYANAYPLQQGCACNCEPGTATFQVWQYKDGPADRFAAKAIGRWFNRMKNVSMTEAFSKTELLILMGRSAKGIWSLETLETDAGGEVYTDLVCTNIQGKRKVFPVIKGLYNVNTSSLSALVLRRLRGLAKAGQWDVGSLTPVKLPLLSKPPELIFQERGKLDDEDYVWSLNVRTRDGRLVRISRDRADLYGEFFRGAKCFGGVRDKANGETWWILIKTAAIDNCSAQWYSIRLTHRVLIKQKS